MTFQLRPSMVSTSDLSKAGRSIAYDKSGTGKVAREIVTTSILGGGGVSLVRRFPVFFAKTGVRIYKHGLLPAMLLAPARKAMGPDYRVGFRFGLDKTVPIGYTPLGMYEPTLRKLPIPVPGFGFTAVPNEEGFFQNPFSKSRGGEDAASTGTPRSTRTATKTIVGPLAKHGRAYPDSSAEERPRPAGRERGRPSKGKRRRRWNSEAVIPYCWRHKRRHYCEFTK